MRTKKASGNIRYTSISTPPVGLRPLGGNHHPPGDEANRNTRQVATATLESQHQRVLADVLPFLRVLQAQRLRKRRKPVLFQIGVYTLLLVFNAVCVAASGTLSMHAPRNALRVVFQDWFVVVAMLAYLVWNCLARLLCLSRVLSGRGCAGCVFLCAGVLVAYQILFLQFVPLQTLVAVTVLVSGYLFTLAAVQVVGCYCCCCSPRCAAGVRGSTRGHLVVLALSGAAVVLIASGVVCWPCLASRLDRFSSNLRPCKFQASDPSIHYYCGVVAFSAATTHLYVLQCEGITGRSSNHTGYTEVLEVLHNAIHYNFFLLALA
jgi:hypothetical protein